MNKTVTRSEFVKGIIRIILTGFLSVIAIALGSRIVSGRDCMDCPGRGICGGTRECEIYGKKTEDRRPKTEVIKRVSN